MAKLLPDADVSNSGFSVTGASMWSALSEDEATLDSADFISTAGSATAEIAVASTAAPVPTRMQARAAMRLDLGAGRTVTIGVKTGSTGRVGDLVVGDTGANAWYYGPWADFGQITQATVDDLRLGLVVAASNLVNIRAAYIEVAFTRINPVRMVA